jgi:transcriptional regulator with GAF, ATPase, and Fis domain
LIAATNRDLPAAVAAGTFREDLFYRLNVFPIAVPPLRQRVEDIPLLVEYFVGRYAKKAGKNIRHIGKRTLDRMDQAILAEFILDGHFGQHVRRMRETYARRMSILREAARQRLNELTDVVQADSGMRTVAWIKTGQSDREVAERARARGLELAAISEFTIRHARASGLVLGFAGCPAAELRRGVDVLANVLEGYQRQARGV